MNAFSLINYLPTQNRFVIFQEITLIGSKQILPQKIKLRKKFQTSIANNIFLIKIFIISKISFLTQYKIFKI